MNVCDLNVGQVEDWLSDLHNTLAWNTVRHAKGVLGSLLTFAARRDEDGVTFPHVAQRAQLPGEEPAGRVVAADPEAIAAVLTKLLSTNLELATFERIAAITGARRGEVAALCVSDVFENGLMFNKALRMELVDGHAVLSIGPTKTKHSRFVECDATTMAIVNRFVRPRQVVCSNVSADNVLLFADANGGPMHPERWSHRWRRACALEGVTTHQHALRHMVGTLTAETLGLRVAQERLGHARVTTTQRYAHVRAIQGTAAANLMATALLAEEAR